MQHLGLHCARIQLDLEDGEHLDVRCPVRPDLLQIWQQLPWWEQACHALPTLLEDAAAAEEARMPDADGATSVA